MANATCRVPVVIIADSRGSGLQAEFDMMATQPFDVKVLSFKGKGILDAVQMAISKLIWWAPKIIVILNGLCDLTQKDKASKRVSLRYQSVEEAVLNHTESMDHARHYLYVQLIESPCQLVFAHVVGMDLMKYNKENGQSDQQAMLDESITAINIAVNRFNEQHDAVAPWLARDIHRNVGGRKITRYQKLSEDGVHLTEVIKEKWAVEILSALRKNWEKVLVREGRPGNVYPIGSEILIPP